jgi:heme/copper-type cytochrome/quinol oxidase subunit 2
MTRLRSFAASARQARVRFATAGRACATAAFVLIAGSSSVLACPMCFGAEETSMIDATKLGILVMLAITIAVQGGFVGFFIYLRRRAKRHAEHELDIEWSELQRPSRT